VNGGHRFVATNVTEIAEIEQFAHWGFSNIAKHGWRLPLHPQLRGLPKATFQVYQYFRFPVILRVTGDWSVYRDETCYVRKGVTKYRVLR